FCSSLSAGHPLSHASVHLRHLHSFPTRRSSDLVQSGERAALPGIQNGLPGTRVQRHRSAKPDSFPGRLRCPQCTSRGGAEPGRRSEEHTSELQSLTNLVCRLLLEKKNIASESTS